MSIYSVVVAFIELLALAFIPLVAIAIMTGDWSHVIMAGSFVGIFVIFGVGAALSRLAKNQGTKFLAKDLAYLGYELSYYKAAKPLLDGRPTKPLNRVFAYLAYRADILNFLIKGERTHTKTGDIEFRYGYVDKKLRKEVYDAIKNERKMLKANPGIPKSEYPLASYLFIENMSQEPDLERIAFFQANNYPIDTSMRLKEVDTDSLKQFDGVPAEWVENALIGTQK